MVVLFNICNSFSACLGTGMAAILPMWSTVQGFAAFIVWHIKCLSGIGSSFLTWCLVKNQIFSKEHLILIAKNEI